MKLMLVGDVHSARWAVTRAMGRAQREEVDRVFFLGDFGYHFSDTFLDHAQSLAEDTGINVEFLDGNHENFNRLYTFPVVDGVRKLRDNVWHHPRGTVLDLDGHNVLIMGGASSIDRLHRQEGVSWWEQELITGEDIETAEQGVKGKRITAIFSHEGPVLPGGSNKDDQELLELYPRLRYDIEISRQQRAKIRHLVNLTKAPYIYHGHHHVFIKDTLYHADGGTTAVQCLGNEDWPVHENSIILHTEDWDAHLS